LKACSPATSCQPLPARKRPWVSGLSEPFSSQVSHQSAEQRRAAVAVAPGGANDATGVHLKLALQRRSQSRGSSRESSTILPPGSCQAAPSRVCAPSQSSACCPSPTAETQPTVPAVFPFPEPIPHGPPSRAATKALPNSKVGRDLRPPEDGADLPIAPAGQASTGGSCLPSGSCRYNCNEREFLAKNRSRANAWISDCVPQIYLFHAEKVAWVRHKHERAENHATRVKLLREMQPMPFEDWCAEKSGQAAAPRSTFTRSSRLSRLSMGSSFQSSGQ